LGEADAFEPAEEIEMPPVATELSVGDGPQANAFLVGGDLGDRLVLDGAQLRTADRTIAPRLSGTRQTLRSQQAADVVGSEW
jgi:hypothetical protein